MTENQPYQPGQPAEPARAEPAPQEPPQDWREARREARDDWREQRREWREQRREARQGGAWIWGIFLIALGAGFLLENMGVIDFRNWWAVFILLPAVGSFQNAWNQYRGTGRWTAEARGSLIGGLIFTAVAFIFFFGISFSALWPVLLIGGGVLLLLNALLPG